MRLFWLASHFNYKIQRCIIQRDVWLATDSDLLKKCICKSVHVRADVSQAKAVEFTNDRHFLMQIEQFVHKYHNMHIWLWWKLEILLNAFLKNFWYRYLRKKIFMCASKLHLQIFLMCVKFWETLKASSQIGSLGRMVTILKSVVQWRMRLDFSLNYNFSGSKFLCKSHVVGRTSTNSISCLRCRASHFNQCVTITVLNLLSIS